MTDICPHHSGIEAKLDALCSKINIRFEAQEKALEMATKDMDRRLEGMNEFRRQLDSQANTFATRAELRGEADKLDLKLAPLLRTGAMQEGSNKWSDYLIMACISAVIVLLSKLFHI